MWVEMFVFYETLDRGCRNGMYGHKINAEQNKVPKIARPGCYQNF